MKAWILRLWGFRCCKVCGVTSDEVDDGICSPCYAVIADGGRNWTEAEYHQPQTAKVRELEKLNLALADKLAICAETITALAERCAGQNELLTGRA